ncbi:MAG TPA: SDR family oxidoreductase [Caulobacter sp.]|nr:SDR family oxidoreductase [Caulobacter sp.]
MHIDLTGKTVLVTGASRGIGAAIATAMAASGARVAVHYSVSETGAAAVAAECGPDARTFGADLGDPADCVALWDAVTAAYGRVDVLVNNAGVAAPVDDPSIDHWLKVWNRTHDVNLRACALLCHLACEHFQAEGGGRIINISSRAAFRGDQPDYIAYAASKGGMVALTRSIARGFGKAGIVAFNVAPGFTRTAMAQDFIDQYGEDYATSDIALSRLTEPKDVAPTVVFLASGLADHATGATIDINAASYVH